MKKGKGRGNKRRTKKARKGKKRNQKKEKSSRRNNRLQRKPNARATRQLNDNCFEQAVHFMKVWKDIVGNFEKQRKRMVKQNKTGGNKSGKKGLFAPAAHRLVDIGGGNKSNMSCGGQYGNAGAAQLQNLSAEASTCYEKTYGGKKTNSSDACYCWTH